SYSFPSISTPTTDSHTLSLHDALPIYRLILIRRKISAPDVDYPGIQLPDPFRIGNSLAQLRSRHGRTAEYVVSIIQVFLQCGPRSEEHTSELQSRENLVCRLLLEKKKR